MHIHTHTDTTHKHRSKTIDGWTQGHTNTVDRVRGTVVVVWELLLLVTSVTDSEIGRRSNDTLGCTG